MQKGQVQLEGISFPALIRDQGASIEVMKMESKVDRPISDWAKENLLGGDSQWGIIAESKTREENQFLSISFKKIQRTRLKLQNGRVQRIQEETTEPEISEFHVRQDGLLELYSFVAKQKTALTKSLSESYGTDCLVKLNLQKDAMKSLMTEATEVNSVSLTGLGNPFFSDATLTGTDPPNSKTYKELSSLGEIKSFRGKFQLGNAGASSQPILVAVHSNCKIRFFGGQTPVPQTDVEDFAKRIVDIATNALDI